MKKFITAAALIAASTALANAATVLTTTFSNAAQTSATAVTLTNATAENVTVNGASLALTKTGTGSGTGDLLTAGAAGGDVSVFSPNTNVGNGGTWTTTFSYSGVSGIDTLDSISIFATTFGSTGAYQTVDRTITFNVSLKSGTTTLASGTNTLTFKSNNTENGQSIDFSFASVDVSSYSDLTVEVSAQRGQNETSGTFVGLKSVAFSGSAIPEPSAFGLLAGIGALALAVSRRRRSR